MNQDDRTRSSVRAFAAWGRSAGSAGPWEGSPGRYATLAALAIAVAFGSVAGPLDAQVRTEIPEEDAGPPFYARIDREAVHTDILPHTDDWGAIVFYRSPSCVPVDFNLMDLFDLRAAFGCRLTVEGFQIWRNGPPPVDVTPMFARFRGLGAVPIWFVSWPDLQDAVTDDRLTLRELMAMPSLLMGSASYYRENLHPTGGAHDPSRSLTAHGTLDDGRVFRLHHSGKAAGVRTVIRISE